VTSYAEIERQATIFLELSEPVLAGRFPRGEVVILAGEGGAGKGQTGIWLARGHRAAGAPCGDRHAGG
jgi:KaiC/GvpD/RAD55 family RecA-like ATPase